MIDINEWCGKTRYEMDMSRAELCRRSGIRPNSMWKVESGYATPSYITLMKILDVTGYRLVFTDGNVIIRDKDFPEFLKETRKSQGLSQETLAGISATSNSQIANFELRKTKPSWYTMNRLAETLGWKVEFEKVEGNE